jgi:protein-L-isoaspartate(D-aspartate) O-methyltransferase
MPDYAAQRHNMVVSQIQPNGVNDEALLKAFEQVPRERFVPAAKRSVAYADAPLEIVHGRYLLAPRTFAMLLQLAELESTDRVLDVGCATGYSTAVLARLAARVTALEQDADLVRIAIDQLREAGAANGAVVQGPLADGHRQAAPYNAIVVNGGIEQTPQTLLSQLAEGGRLVAILQQGPRGQGIVYLKEDGRIGHRLAFDAAVAVLAGFRRPAGFVF